LTASIQERRVRYVKAGYEPLPCIGKRPAPAGWQALSIDVDVPAAWSASFPAATNTGIRTRRTPAIDIDVRDAAVADQLESALRASFPSALVRFGMPPKRLIPFRCETPFKKIAVSFKSPDNVTHKVEVLGDGQQFIADGIHPDTGEPYTWRDGADLLSVAHEHLPLLDEAAARRFVAEASAIMTAAGWQGVGGKTNGNAPPLPLEAKAANPYYHFALKDECAALAAMPKDSGRNDKLNRAAFGLFQLVAGGGLDENVVRDHLFAAAEMCGLVAEDGAASVRATIDSGAKAGREQPRQAPDHDHGGDQDEDRPDNNAPPIKTSAQFIAGFVPPDYAVVGLLQRRFLYACTGQTGAGKTAIMLRLAASAALGEPFAGRATKRCRVLYAAAENPDDVRMRWIALAQHMGFDPQEIGVYFIEGRFAISKAEAWLHTEAERLGGEFGLVIIDTGPAFYEGDDENNRVQQGVHARMMRGLITTIPGQPCVVVNCHPVKHAAADNLLPAGGGNFLNEIDGNLTAARNDSVTELHHQGKFRGPEFGPMSFMLKTVTHQDLKDSDGRLIPTIICDFISDQAREEIIAAGRKDEDEILRMIDRDPAASLATLAIAMKWKLHGGEPNKMKAKRCVDSLKKAKLIKENQGRAPAAHPGG
jgi:hypothetical protein